MINLRLFIQIYGGFPGWKNCRDKRQHSWDQCPFIIMNAIFQRRMLFAPMPLGMVACKAKHPAREAQLIRAGRNVILDFESLPVSEILTLFCPKR